MGSIVAGENYKDEEKLSFTLYTIYQTYVDAFL